MKAVFKRELFALLTSPTGYVLLAAFVAGHCLASLYVMPWVLGFPGNWFVSQDLSMGTYFGAFPWTASAVLPALTMRSWAEERRNGSLSLLMTLPIRTRSIVIGKLLSLEVFLALMLVSTLPFAWMVVDGGGIGRAHV